MHTINDKKILLLRPSDILCSPDRPRKIFDEYELHTLASSILSIGVVEPLCVRRTGKEKYTLISGERRLKAAKIAGIRRVPCVVHNVDDKSAAVYSLASNINRENLNFFEQAEAINRLIGVYNIEKSDFSNQLGMAVSTLQHKLELLKIPKDCRERIIYAGLTESHAAAIAGTPKSDMPLILDAVISEQLSVKQTKELISSANKPLPEEPKPAPVIRKSAIGDIKFFSNSLAKLLITMQNSGIRTSLVHKEENDYIEYKIRIENRAKKQMSFFVI